MAWTGCRDKRGLPICFIDIKYLTSNLEAYKKSCDALSASRLIQTGLPSAMTFCLLAVLEGMIRFVLPLSSSSQETGSRNTCLSGHSHSRYLGRVTGAYLEDQKLVSVL